MGQKGVALRYVVNGLALPKEIKPSRYGAAEITNR